LALWGVGPECEAESVRFDSRRVTSRLRKSNKELCALKISCPNHSRARHSIHARVSQTLSEGARVARATASACLYARWRTIFVRHGKHPPQRISTASVNEVPAILLLIIVAKPC